MALLKKIIYLLIILFPLLELGKLNLAKSLSISINDIIVGVIFIFFIILTICKKIKIKNELFLPILLFFTTALISLIISLFSYSLNQVFISSLYLLRWISYALVYLIIVNFKVDEKKVLQKLLLISGLVILIIGYLQFFFYNDLANLYYLQWDKHLYRLFSTFFDPNFAGAFFVLFTIYVLGYLLVEKNNNKKILFSIITIFSTIAIVLTYSRSALLMLIASIITFLILTKKSKYILYFIIILFIALVLSPKSFQTEGTNLFRSYSSMERVKSARIASDIFIKNPIIGVGFNTYRYAQNKYGYLSGDKWEVTHSGSGTDNSFLFILATTGLIGFVVYINLLSKILKLQFRKIDKSSFVKSRWAVVSISSIVGLLINSLFLNSLFYPPIMLWLWMIIGFTKNN